MGNKVEFLLFILGGGIIIAGLTTIGMIVLGILVLRWFLGSLAKATSKISGHAIYQGTKAVAGEDFALRHVETIRKAGTVIGTLGVAALAAKLVSDHASDRGIRDFSPEVAAEPLADGSGGVDLDHDGRIDGLDVNADGVIDTNLNGVPIPPLTNISAYTRDDGTSVREHVRTIPDEDTSNNLRVQQH
jgi:hypothetical protein